MELKQFYQLNQEERVKIFDKIVEKALQMYDFPGSRFKYFAEYSNILYKLKLLKTKNIC